MTFTAYKNGKFSFVWAMGSRNEAVLQAMRWLREGRGRSAEVANGDRIVWFRGTKDYEKVINLPLTTSCPFVIMGYRIMDGMKMNDLIKTIKSCKEVYIDVALESTSMWVKVDKKFLIEKLTSREKYSSEIEIVTQYGKSALYLGRKF